MRRFILLLIISYIATPCFAYIEKNMKILTMENGLPNNIISCIYRDNDGFMWFATKKGISRYDGTNFKNFTLPCHDQVVTNIFGSSKNYIWTWGNGNLNCLNTESERFMDIELPDEMTNNNISYTTKVFNDSIAWIITKTSVLKTIVITKNHKRTLKLISKQQNIVDSTEQILATDVDKKGNLYISTNRNRVLIIDIENRITQIIKLELRKSLAHSISNITYLNVIDNSIWMNTSGQGVIRYFIDTKEIQQFDDYPNIKFQIPHTNVFQTIKLDDNRYLFVTWNGYNVITYDQADRTPISIKSYSNSYSDTHRSVECRIGSVYIDNDNILWLGTFGSGIIVSNLNLQFYKQFHQDLTNAIESMAIDRWQHLWISTYHKGLFRSKEPVNDESILDFKLIHNNVIRGVKTNSPTILCDKSGRIWSGMRNGVVVLYGENGGIEKEIEICVDSLSSKLAINCMLFDKDSNLWIGTPEGVIYVCDMETGKSKLMKNITSAMVNNITEDSIGNLWFSTTKGAIKYDPFTKTITAYNDDFNINSILSTKNGLYLATNDGLISIDSQGNTTILTTKNGLCNDQISSITEGCNGEIWACNESGISRYSSIDKTIFNYYIQSSNSSAARANDGTLFFGNNKSITYFNPAKLSDLYKRILNKRIKITQLKIVGETVNAGDTVNGDVVLRQSIQKTSRIVLNHKNNNFSLNVSNMLFNDVHKRCMYRMLPVQPNWTIVNNSTPISYTALPAGNYIFQVKDYSNGNNETPITELEIRINNHWVLSLLARILVIIFFLVFLFVIFLRMRLRHKRQLYLTQLNSKLESQRSELNREKKTNQERVNFFTYASHELRTPLTLIISPLKELISQDKITNDVKTKLLTIEQNAHSLLNITNKLLDFQQLDAKITKLDISRVDIIELTRRVISNFDLPCKENNIEITLTNSTNEPQVWLHIDQQKIESIISNLVSNSIKYRKEHGATIDVEINKEEVDSIDYIIMTINDNGQGISNEAQKTIFESFSTDDNNPLFSTKMGVGLFIVRNLIELHHGKISLLSNINKGTTITLHLPLKQDHTVEGISYITNEPNEIIPNSKPKDKKKLLIVEDNNEIINYILSLFCNNYDVLTAENGKEGLIIAKEKLPDVILQDIMLPDINGIECCKELIRNFETSHIPIILLSAKADEQSIMEGANAGAADYVVKPFNAQILKTKVASLISSREMLKQIYSKSLMLNGKSVHKVLEDNFMQKIINITEQNLTNPEFGVGLLAQKLNMSISTMRRYLKSYSDLPLNSIIRDVRLTKAASLIISQKYRVSEIAEMVGYNDISSFRAQFAKKFGVSPSKFHNV